MKIIGLTGFAKSGKSTAAEVLRAMGGQEIAFAKHLKDVCAEAFHVPRSHFDDQKFKETLFSRPICVNVSDCAYILMRFDMPPRRLRQHEGVKLRSPREVAQYIGTDVLRSLDANIHINMAFKLNKASSAPFLICSDVRFQNEMEAVQKEGGYVIGISRKAAMPLDLSNLHASEAEVPNLISKADFILENESTISAFQEELKKLLEPLVGEKEKARHLARP